MTWDTAWRDLHGLPREGTPLLGEGIRGTWSLASLDEKIRTMVYLAPADPRWCAFCHTCIGPLNPEINSTLIEASAPALRWPPPMKDAERLRKILGRIIDDVKRISEGQPPRRTFTTHATNVAEALGQVGRVTDFTEAVLSANAVASGVVSGTWFPSSMARYMTDGVLRAHRQMGYSDFVLDLGRRTFERRFNELFPAPTEDEIIAAATTKRLEG